jgi:hypothetical protein
MTFIFLMAIFHTMALSWNTYRTWVGVVLNMSLAAFVATVGVHRICSGAPESQSGGCK